jgi:hypothetical protein
MLHLFVDVGRHQHLLGGDATAKRAGSAQAGVFLNNRGLQTQLPGANCGHISAWSTTDNRDIKLFVSQFSKVPLVNSSNLPVSDEL